MVRPPGGVLSIYDGPGFPARIGSAGEELRTPSPGPTIPSAAPFRRPSIARPSATARLAMESIQCPSCRVRVARRPGLTNCPGCGARLKTKARPAPTDDDDQ